MSIVCPSCNATYKRPSGMLPDKTLVATCKRCGGKIRFDPRNASVTTTQAGPAPVSPPSAVPAEAGQPVADPSEILSVYPELQALPTDRVNLGAILLPDKKGRFKTRKNKFKAKVLMAVADKIGKVLTDGETVLRVAKGTAYYPLELFIGNGYLTMLYNHYAILATNRRLVFININQRMKRATHYLLQLPYEDIRRVKKGMLLNHLILYRHKGKRRIFTAVKRYLLKELIPFIQQSIDSMETAPVTEASPEKLCPACCVPLDNRLTDCPACGAAFKTPKRALVKSLILPGWGDFYLGHRILGSLELLGSVVVWVMVVSLVLAGGSVNFALAGLLLLFYNALDGLLTYHMANKGYMLA